jgi:hypothetical protein
MTNRSAFLLLFGLAFLTMTGRAQNQDKCAISDYRIAASNSLLLYCKISVKLSTPVKVTVYPLDPASQRGAPIQGSLAPTPTGEKHWFEVKLDSALAPELQYQIIDSTGNATPSFDLYSFDTKASGTLKVIDSPVCKDSHLVILQSNVALDPATLSRANVAVTDGRSSTASMSEARDDHPNTALVGQATTCIPFVSKAGQTKDLTLTSVSNVFAQSIRAKGSYGAPSPPAQEKDATYYAKFDGQAGTGQKPGYTLEAMAAPKLANLGESIYFVLSGNADLGFGSSDTSKITDMIKAGAGVTHYFSTSRIEFEPFVQYETDRHGAHRNLLFDSEAQYFGTNWRRSISQRNYDEYVKRVKAGGADAPKDPKEVNKYHWGLMFETHLGTEIGGALSSDTVRSSDKKTSVVLPTYDIARLKPSVNATVEYKQVSLTATATPRFLFVRENVTREVTVPNPTSPTSTIQSIYLAQRDGWRTLGNVTVLWTLDPPGHFSWSVTYKVGSEPPNFNHVNQVETGIVLIY